MLMKKYCFWAVMAIAMLAVSCNDSDPFLGDIKPKDYKTNKKNFDEFTDALLTGCYIQWNHYEKIDDKHWGFIDYWGWIGGGTTYCFMIDSETLIKWEESGDYGPTTEVWCTKYSISYNPADATISTTEILPDGTNGKTYSSTLLSGAPRPVIEGPFAGMYYIRIADDDSLINLDIRWCFKECDDRAEILEKYEKWLSEQEK